MLFPDILGQSSVHSTQKQHVQNAPIFSLRRNMFFVNLDSKRRSARKKLAISKRSVGTNLAISNNIWRSVKVRWNQLGDQWRSLTGARGGTQVPNGDQQKKWRSPPRCQTFYYSVVLHVVADHLSCQTFSLGRECIILVVQIVFRKILK